MKYYIAYGSNLNIAQMAKRCPDAKIYGVDELKDYELLFKGQAFQAYLTIEPKEGSSVPIVIWEVSYKDEQNLDLYEGYPLLYDKHTIKLDSGIEAFVYIMKDEAGIEISVPSKPYFNTCERGYKDFNFDIDVLENAYLKYFFG